MKLCQALKLVEISNTGRRPERFTYINTLVALFKGFGMKMQNAIKLLEASMQKYEQQGSDIATAILKIMQQKKVTGLYITGSGPHAGTTM